MAPAITEGLETFTRALTLFRQRRIAESIPLFLAAEELGHNPDECAGCRWQCWMLLGDFERAWQESDRIASPAGTTLWDGAPFTGKRVVIRCLHGFGDAIQFLRYAPMVRRHAAGVFVETHPELVRLFTNLPGVDSVITWAGGNPLPRTAWDQHVEVMELPRIFRTTLDTIPAPIPYLHVPPAAIARSRRHLPSGPKPNIGVLWASSMWNPARCLRLTDLLPVLRSPDYTFCSFQRGPAKAELSALPPALDLHDTATHSPDIQDTAADLLNLDLLITPDTMAAHLAGALGIPVWTLLIHESDWRWMLDRADTPWYPTMRLFRQPEPGDWTSVVRSVAAALPRFFATSL